MLTVLVIIFGVLMAIFGMIIIVLFGMCDELNKESNIAKAKLAGARTEIEKHGGPHLVICASTDNPWNDGYHSGLRVALAALDRPTKDDAEQEE